MTPHILRCAWCLLAAAALAACGPSPVTPAAAVPTSTVTIVPRTTLPLPIVPAAPSAPAGCDRDQVVVDLRSSLPYAEASLSHSALYNVHTLNLWFVDPGIDPSAAEADISRYADMALRDAAAVSHVLRQASACVASAFDGITIRVVDREYNEWYTGQVDPRLVPTSAGLSQDDLAQLASAFVPGYQRSSAPRPAPESASTAETCRWDEAHARLEVLFGAGQPNATSYVVRDDEGTNVWVQWEGPPVFEIFLADVTRIASVLPCLESMDTLWLIYVDSEGQTQLILAAAGEAVRTVEPAQLVEHLEIIYPPPQ